MLYLHDVWVNWFEGEENGYNICHFHEWRKEDGIELLDQVPLLKVTKSLFIMIENDLKELPPELLKDVYQKAYCRKNHERIQLEYCFVMTDGSGILAVDTMGYQIPIRKSRRLRKIHLALFVKISHILGIPIGIQRNPHHDFIRFIHQKQKVFIGKLY